MSALAVSAIIFLSTLGGIFLGALLRRTLPKHHLNEHAKDVVRLGAGLIATIAALVLGLLIAAAKGSFDTQSTHLKHITADLILLDNILAQYGPEARPIREAMRSTVGPFVDRLWREKEAVTSGPFETDGAAERVDLEIQKLSPHDAVQRSLQARAVQISTIPEVYFRVFYPFHLSAPRQQLAESSAHRRGAARSPHRDSEIGLMSRIYLMQATVNIFEVLWPLRDSF